MWGTGIPRTADTERLFCYSFPLANSSITGGMYDVDIARVLYHISQIAPAMNKQATHEIPQLGATAATRIRHPTRAIADGRARDLGA